MRKLSKQKILIYSTGYHSRLIFRSQKKNYLIKGFLDRNFNLHGKKIFGNYKIFNPQNHNQIKFDKILFAGRSDIDVNRIIKFYNFPKEKIIKLKKIDITPIKKKIVKRENQTIKMIKNFVKVMHQNNFEHMFTHSSLLAILRKDYFARYSDVDIFILNKDFNKVYLNLKKQLNKYSIKKYLHNKNSKQITISENLSHYNMDREAATIDIASIILKKNKYFYKSFKKKKFSIPSYQFDKKIIYRYKKINFFIPYETQNYMKLLYNVAWFKRPKDWSQ